MTLKNNSLFTVDDLQAGLALIDENHEIADYNQGFADAFGYKPDQDPAQPRNFYKAIGYPEIIDGSFAPLYFAARGKERDPVSCVLRWSGSENGVKERCCDMTVTRLTRNGKTYFLAELRDISQNRWVEKMFGTLQKAGSNLVAILDSKKKGASPETLAAMLKEAISRDMEGTLNYSVVEIRRVHDDGELIPFHSFGLAKDVTSRPLKVGSNGQGTTGYVAEVGEPYVCNDTLNDPLYIEGMKGALSSVTVPLIYRGKVIGTCNVESKEPSAFSRRDVVFLQLYAKDLAVAIHLLDVDLLTSQEARAECIKEVNENVFVPFNSIEVDLCEARARTCENAPTNQAEIIGEIDEILANVRRINAEAIRLRNAYLGKGQTHPVGKAVLQLKKEHADTASNRKIDLAAEFLSDARCLLVARDPSLFTGLAGALEARGSTVEIHKTTRTALQALASGRDWFSLVICERYGDATYFAEGDNMDGQSPNGFNLVDIHLPGYFDGLPTNPQDLSDPRARIWRLIHEERKLDAYFFWEEALKLWNGPLSAPYFFVAIDDGYDCTHVTRDLAGNIRMPAGFEKPAQPCFKYSSEVDQIQEAVNRFVWQLAEEHEERKGKN